MKRKNHQETCGTWIVFLCNQAGFWVYDRWVTRSTDILRVIDDVLYGIDTGIIEVDKGVVITIVEAVA